MELKFSGDLRKLVLAHKNELELLGSEKDGLKDLVDLLKKTTIKQKPFPPVDQSAYSEESVSLLEAENAKLVRVVNRVQLQLTEALEANLLYKVN